MDRLNQKTIAAGFTLVELLITLSLVAILASQAIPLSRYGMQSARSDVALQAVERSLVNSRQSAVSRGRPVTFCGSDDGIHCQRYWRHLLLVFEDSNRNGRVEEGETVVLKRRLNTRGQYRLRVSAARTYLSFDALGYAKQWGNLQWCPDIGDRRYARNLIVNRQGRVRRGRDINRNRIWEDAYGRDLVCPL